MHTLDELVEHFVQVGLPRRDIYHGESKRCVLAYEGKKVPDGQSLLLFSPNTTGYKHGDETANRFRGVRLEVLEYHYRASYCQVFVESPSGLFAVLRLLRILQTRADSWDVDQLTTHLGFTPHEFWDMYGLVVGVWRGLSTLYRKYVRE